MERIRRVTLLLLLGVSAAQPWTPGLPTGWESAPGSLAEFPSGCADPWLYSDRLGLYKMLIRSTPSLHFNHSEFNNPLWGLPLQFSWQHDTGRLGGGSLAILNGSSWWGNMNYILSVLPVLAAQHAGLISNQLRIAPPPPHAAIGCTTYAECLVDFPNATSKWSLFMGLVSAGELDVEGAVVHMWEAHINSLHEGLPAAARLLEFLPSSQEAEFGVSWANLVDFVAALRFDVNYNNTNFLQGMVMPPRVLKVNDTAPFIPDFSGPQNRALLASSLLYKANRDGSVLKLFSRICCTAPGRTVAYDALVGFLQNPWTDVGRLVALLWKLVRTHPC